MISNLKSREENSEYLKSVIGIDGRKYIDWKNSVGKEIEYEYHWEREYSKGILKIIKYEVENGKIYFEGYEKGIYHGELTRCMLGWILNIIWHKEPWMMELGVSEKDAKKYTYGSTKKIDVICPYCGKNKKIAPCTIHQYHSIMCSCGDGIPYPEKFMESVLIQLNINYKTQYSPDWIKPKRYDFYLPNYNIIIETHGIQHYEDTGRGRSLKEEQKNDEFKKELALNNGVKHYIVINCSESELEYIKNNILDSELNKLFDLSNINWIQCEEYALKNKVKEVCDYYKKHQGIFTTDLIKEFNMDRSTIIDYLKKGTKLGWCKYDAKEEVMRGSKLGGELRSKPVSQFTLEGEFIKTYPSTMEAERQTGIFNGYISSCCNGKQKTTGGYIWKFVE